ncbi:hypothetical protein HPB48_009212 [Haemaphysalis longicornis]|uniref:Uncharacterized protein n=1 Tax=Haemaphysalis longicornis TaxID=44386 RepID=A0A9J6G809_HAELO|nr:hypothetical protein HPB48_009212 [Haemaphysalis longicornis]
MDRAEIRKKGREGGEKNGRRGPYVGYTQQTAGVLHEAREGFQKEREKRSARARPAYLRPSFPDFAAWEEGAG